MTTKPSETEWSKELNWQVQMSRKDIPDDWWPLERHLGQSEHDNEMSAKREAKTVRAEMRSGFRVRVIKSSDEQFQPEPDPVWVIAQSIAKERGEELVGKE